MRLKLLSLLMKTLRLFVYKTVAAIKLCRNLNYQMFNNANLQNAYNSLNRGRKYIFIGIIALVLLLYLWPSWLTFGGSDIKIDTAALCLSSKISTYEKQFGAENVITRHSILQENEKEFLPFVGNGYLGTVYDGKSQLQLRHGRALAVPAMFYPVVTVNIEGFPSQEAYATTILSGVTHKVQCFKVQEKYCVAVITELYAHRTRPGVLLQEFKIWNPSDEAVTVDLKQIGLSGWEGATSVSRRAEQIKSTIIDYTLTTGEVPIPNHHDRIMLVGIAAVKLPESVTVQATTTWSHHIMTVVRYVEKRKGNQIDLTEDKNQLTKLVEDDLNAVIIMNTNVLREEHEMAWNQIWNSGLSISQSLAPGAVNGDQINMSLYYVLSNTLSPLLEKFKSESEKSDLRRLLYFPDRCYEGHHTLQNERLWEVAKSVDTLIELVKVWIITLEKQGCYTMLKAGVDGVLQAMLLSMGPLQFKNDHLEFRSHPNDLHRDYFFRRINYGNNTHVNISVIVGDDNKAVLYVALDRNDKHFYACDAGCLDTPVKLSREVQEFPVKLTQPLTAILYITFDKPHIEELKHAIHVKEIAIAPAHEHHVMAMHRHGHHLGGLPVLFWGSIGFLILTFHLFLFKLVYNEYCAGGEGAAGVRYGPRARYM